jgi:hypothetical protein
MKKYIFLVCIFCLVQNVMRGQIAMNGVFEFDNFQISPAERTIYVKQWTSGTDYDENGNNAIHWHGHKYVPTKEIDFETTSLIFMGGVTAFKEYFPIKIADIPSLKVIYSSIGYGNEYTMVLSSSDNKLYAFRKNQLLSQNDVSGFKHIRQLIFKHENGKLYFKYPDRLGLYEITIPVDEATIQYVASNYFVDKNGLYFFDPNATKTQKLESNTGKFLQPILHGGYFIYGNAAYPYARAAFEQKDLRLNANEVSFIFTSYASYIGDKNKLFILPYDISNQLIGSSISPKDIVQDNLPQASINNWKCFDIITVGDNLKNNVLYYSSAKHYAGSGRPHSLIKMPDGFYGVSGSSARLGAVKFDNVMIYNLQKDDYEPIEVDKFRRLSTNFYIYKNQMYGYNSCPVETDLNLEKLQQILHHGKATEFYTDGTFLLGGYNLSKMKIEQRKNQKWYLFDQPLFRDVDWKSLQVLSEKLLIDKNNIYQVNNTMLEVIPIKSLVLDVKVVSAVGN